MFFLWVSILLQGQYVDNADALNLGGECFEITQDESNSYGTVWRQGYIDMTKDFEKIIRVNFGDKDEDGGNGIIFGLQTIGHFVGNYSGEMGFDGVAPSFLIEMDTWQNPEHNDPAYDHMAILIDGNLDHGQPTTLTGPTLLDPDSENVEDGEDHFLRVTWNAQARVITAYFDCQLRLSYEMDIVAEVFDGNNQAIWGYAAGTGTGSNQQIACSPDFFSIDYLQDIQMCPGTSVVLNAFPDGENYIWTPTESLSDSTIANPTASPDTTTTYYVSIRDECETLFIDSLTVFVEGTPVDLDFGDGDTVLCDGAILSLDVTNANADYQWSTGSNDAIVEIETSGMYSVTVDIGVCQASDLLEVLFSTSPQLDLGIDTFLCEGENYLLSPGFSNAGYQWQNGSTDSVYVVQSSEMVALTLTNECGSAYDEKEVVFENCDETYIPNAFSPNFDGANDYFTIYGSDKVEQIQSLRIFNRWGALVYERFDFPLNEESSGWNGLFKNKEAEVGVYIFAAELVLRNGRVIRKDGSFSLVR